MQYLQLLKNPKAYQKLHL